MVKYNKHLIFEQLKIKDALLSLGELEDNILFVINKKKQLIGSITDGDVRRGLLKGFNSSDSLKNIIHNTPKFINVEDYKIDDIIFLRKNNYKVVPVVNNESIVVDILNFRFQKSLLPVDAFIMAGGLGSRLKPLTNNLPKPLLKVGGKEIISYNFDRLLQFGISNQHVSVNYLGDMVKKYTLNYNDNINFNVIKEKEFLGTAGSLSLVENFNNDTVLLMNSDILTNIDFEDFYKSFVKHDADIMAASVSYSINLPYAIFKIKDDEVKSLNIKSFEEKPTNTYYANAGIYLIKREVINKIPKNKFYNATDLMQFIIKSPNYQLMHFPIRGYWLDIGKHEDYKKAQIDVKHINF